MYLFAALSHVQPRLTYNPIPMIHVMHPRKFRGCAEPRRGSARCGEAPLVLSMKTQILNPPIKILKSNPRVSNKSKNLMLETQLFSKIIAR